MSQRRDIPELLLEQLLLGELSPEAERALRAQLGSDEVERRLAALRALNQVHAAERTAEVQVPAIRDRLRIESARRDQQKRASGLRVMLPSLVVLGCVGLFLWRGDGTQGSALPDASGPDTTRVKGLSPHLVLYRRRGSDVETLENGAKASQGDMLQVGYVASEARYGVIVSLDGAGAVTLHYPSEEYGTTLLESDGEKLLDHAYELDAAPSFERFFFVTDARPVDVRKVLASARTLARSPEARTGNLGVHQTARQQSLLLVKESAP